MLSKEVFPMMWVMTMIIEEDHGNDPGDPDNPDANGLIILIILMQMC